MRNCWLVGSPDRVVARLEQLAATTGGFGTLLQLSYDYIDDPGPWFHSMELMASEVMPVSPTSDMGGDRDTVRYEHLEAGVVRIVLDRPESRNAQDKAMLYALNEAFDAAAADDDVKVVVLAADGPHFSSGTTCATPVRR